MREFCEYCDKEIDLLGAYYFHGQLDEEGFYCVSCRSQAVKEQGFYDAQRDTFHRAMPAGLQEGKE